VAPSGLPSASVPPAKVVMAKHQAPPKAPRKASGPPRAELSGDTAARLLAEGAAIEEAIRVADRERALLAPTPAPLQRGDLVELVGLGTAAMNGEIGTLWRRIVPKKKGGAAARWEVSIPGYGRRYRLPDANLRLHRPPVLPGEGASVASVATPPPACEPMGPVAPLAAGESETRVCSGCGGEPAPGGACNTAVCAVALRVVCDECNGARELGTGRCHNGEAWCAYCARDEEGCLLCGGDLAPTGPCSTSLCKVKMSLVCGVCDGPLQAGPARYLSNGRALCDACIAIAEGADSVREDEGRGLRGRGRGRVL
jgi:hypothetical protein